MKTNAYLSIGSFAVGGIATLALAFSPSDRAQAATITTLYSTGVNAAGLPLGDATVDSHYTITAAPTAPLVGAAIARTTNYPVVGPGGWVTGGASDWIGPNNGDVNFSAVPGGYTYRTTFDLTGLVASSANITGRWAADDAGIAIKLNGTAVTLASLPGNTAFETFSISSGFTSSINTLEFVINNGSNSPGSTFNPTGLRVELAGTANAATTAVPEPSDIVGTALAFGSVFLLKRNLSKKTVKLDSISK
jgi:hypothetical protein